MASRCRSSTLSRSSRIESLKSSFPEISLPPITTTTSSVTNRSTASGSCAFHTSSHISRTVFVDRMLLTIPLSPVDGRVSADPRHKFFGAYGERGGKPHQGRAGDRQVLAASPVGLV